MSTVYTYIAQVIVTQTGVPGSGSLRVGMGDTLGDALDNLDSTPFGCHESELKAIEWAVEASPDDLEDWEPNDGELRALDDEQWAAYKAAFGATGLCDCENLSYEAAVDWYNCLGFHTEDDEGNQATHPVCPFDSVLDFEPKNQAERKALDYAIRAAKVARALEDYFESAVGCYEEGDGEAVRTILQTASALEQEYGDDPATRDLADKLLIRPL
jgi:hypothetical protein